MSDVDDDIDREASPADVARVAAVVASDFRFVYFGSAAFATRLLRLDEKLTDGVRMNPAALAGGAAGDQPSLHVRGERASSVAILSGGGDRGRLAPGLGTMARSTFGCAALPWTAALIPSD
jgi:hypothetical protein